MGIVVGTGMGIVDGYSHPAPIPYPIYGFTGLLQCSVIGIVRRSLLIFWHYEVKDERFYAHMHTNLIVVEWRIC